MNGFRKRMHAAGLVLAALYVLGGSDALAQSYGPGDQVLTIGAGGFRDDDDRDSWLSSANGYLSPTAPGLVESPTLFVYRSPLSLPEGARITKICMWVQDTDPISDLAVQLEVAKLTYGGQTGGTRTVGPYLASSLAPGYRTYCAALSETVRGMVDVDKDGTDDPAAWYVTAKMMYAGGQDLSLGAVQITWTRQVSDPPASPTFADVPDSHAFYPFIEALAASGITGGCGNGNYCPDAPLTRGQMAAFLAKALGLHWAE